jgi:hypothetical protein
MFLGCVMGGTFSASFIMVVIGMFWFDLWLAPQELDSAVIFFEIVRVPVGVAGALFGLWVFMNHVRSQNSKNEF